MWKTFQEMGLQDHLTCLLRNLYTAQEEAVRSEHGTTDWFKIERGVQQGYILSSVQFSSVAQSCLTLWSNGMQHARPPCPSPTPRVYSNSCLLSRWCHPTNSSSVIPVSCLQSFSESGLFPISWFFTSGGQSIGALASASVFPMNIQSWFPLGLTGLIFLLSKELSRVFFSTTVWKHQLLHSQLSLWPNSHIHTWPLEKSYLCPLDFCPQSDVSAF